MMGIRSRRPHWALAGVALALMLSGCIGGASDTPPPAATVVTGTVMAGPFLDGQVCAYRIDTGVKGAQLACATINTASSTYTIPLGSYSGDVLLEIAANARYDDEANTADDSSGTPVAAGILRSFATVGSGSASAALTPFTEMAIRNATASGGGFIAATIAQKANELRLNLKLDPQINLFTTQPGITPTSGTQLAYKEALRALSQMQYGDPTYQGNLDGHLTYVAQNHLALQSQFTLELGTGLAGGCTITADLLTCTLSVTPPSGLSCDTSKFQPGAAVSTPTSTQLAAFAGNYSGDEGSYDSNFTFVKSGTATLSFGNDGAVNYNGTAYAATSFCYENNTTLGEMIYLHFANSAHIDLFSGLKWSGVSPKDGVTMISGMGSTTSGSGYPTSGPLGALTLSGTATGGTGPLPTAFAPATFLLKDPTVNNYSNWTATDGTHQWTLSFNAFTVMSSVDYGDWQKYSASGIAALGMQLDLPNGEIIFSNVTLDSSYGQMILNGAIKVPAVTGSAVAIAGTGQGAAGSGFDAPAATVTTPDAIYTKYSWDNSLGITLEYAKASQPGYGDSLTVANWLGHKWVLNNPGSAVVLDTVAKSVTFNNAVIPGWSPVTTSLTLSGTLTLP